MTKNSSGSGPENSGAWRARRTPAHLGSVSKLQTAKPKRMKPIDYSKKAT
jgi:hypothetical protein